MAAWTQDEPKNIGSPSEPMNTSDRIELERSHLQEIKKEDLSKITTILLGALGVPTTGDQSRALEFFNNGDWDYCKRICLFDPCDSYLAALSCLTSAYRSPTIADSVLRDAARHTADFSRVRTAHKLAQEFNQILG